MLHSERTQGFTADPDYWNGEVFVYVGRNQNLKDLKAVFGVSLYLVGYPWLELLYFSYGIPWAFRRLGLGACK